MTSLLTAYPDDGLSNASPCKYIPLKLVAIVSFLHMSRLPDARAPPGYPVRPVVLVEAGDLSGCSQRLIQIRQDIVDVLDPDAEPNHIRRHAGRFQLCL